MQVYCEALEIEMDNI